jgi:hypothetical protein
MEISRLWNFSARAHSLAGQRHLIAAICGIGVWVTCPMGLAQEAKPQQGRVAEAAAKVVRSDSYIVEMMGQPAGTSTSTETESDGKIISRTDMKFGLRRGEVEIKISIQTEFVETTDGKPVSMTVNQMLASLPKQETYVFGEKDVKVSTTSMGKTMTNTRPLPGGEWLTPAKAARQARELAKKGEKQINFVTIDPSNGLNLVRMERTRGERAKIKVAGSDVEAWQWDTNVVMEGMAAIKSTEYVDDRGELLRSKTNLGGIAMDLVKATSAEAGKTFRGPEMMVDLFVKPNKAITDPRHTKMLTYVLRVKDGELPELPSEAGQSFTRIDARSATVTVNAVTSSPAKGLDKPESIAAFLASSSMIDAGDEKVAELAAAAVKDIPESQVVARAEALRRAVYRHIDKKALDVGFGSASETARSGVGDCSEHGVLLAAMLRNQNIPARVASGLIYADHFAGERGIFGYHMWTQALIEKNGAKRWVDLDATLPAATPTDATHIAVSVSALGDGEVQSSMMNLVPLLGRLEIQVQGAVATPRQKEQPAAEPAGTR